MKTPPPGADAGSSANAGRRWSRPSAAAILWAEPSIVARAIVGVAIVGVFLAAARTLPFDPSAVGGDAWNYLAAGERLNAGHELYALVPSDRYILIVPPFWTVPLLSPPTIAVLWRPLALLGESAMPLWTLAGLVATAAFAAWIVLRGSTLALVLILVLSPVVGLTAISGNANAFLIPMLAYAWRRPATGGFGVAIAAAVKVTPVLLMAWLLASRRWRSAAVAVAAVGVVTIVGAGPGSLVAWWQGAPGSTASPLSVATTLGLSPTVVFLGGAAIVAVVTFLAPRREALVFGVAVGVAVATSPALYFEALGLLAVPLAIAVPGRRAAAAAS